MKHKAFIAMSQGRVDFGTEVIPIQGEEHGCMMCVCSEEAAIYITKEQAKLFWDLEDKRDD